MVDFPIFISFGFFLLLLKLFLEEFILRIVDIFSHLGERRIIIVKQATVLYRKLLGQHLSLFFRQRLIRLQSLNSVQLFIQEPHPFLFLFFQLLILNLHFANLFIKIVTYLTNCSEFSSCRSYANDYGRVSTYRYAYSWRFQSS